MQRNWYEEGEKACASTPGFLTAQDESSPTNTTESPLLAMGGWLHHPAGGGRALVIQEMSEMPTGAATVGLCGRCLRGSAEQLQN